MRRWAPWILVFTLGCSQPVEPPLPEPSTAAAATPGPAAAAPPDGAAAAAEQPDQALDSPAEDGEQVEEVTPPVPELPPGLSPPARRGRCYVDQALIPAGTFPLGYEGSDELAAWPMAPRTVKLPPFCIDRYEYPNKKGEQPITQTTWARSKEFCAAVGKRLCTEDEWAAACRGTEGRTWAYGNERREGACHSDEDPWGDHGPWTIKPSGSFEDCKTPEGVYDLTGNASEWVATLYTGPDHADLTGVDYPDHLDRPLLRGGTPWQSSYGQSCLARHWHAIGYDQGDGDGFRCCSDARR